LVYASKANVDQTAIATGVATKVTFGTIIDQVDAQFYSAASSKWTPPSGQHMINALITVIAGVVDQELYEVYVYEAGVVVARNTVRASGTGSLSLPITFIYSGELRAGDYEIYFKGSGAGDKTLSGDPSSCWFKAIMLW
jgi:hypothetical protein